MKIAKFLFIVFFGCISNLSAQSYDAHIKTGYNILFRNFDESSVYRELEQFAVANGEGTSASVAVKRKITPWLWLGLESGFSDAENYISRHEYWKDCAEFRLSGTYKIKQRSLALLVEGRHPKLDWLFLNVGMGLFHDYERGFADDLNVRFFDCREWEDFNGSLIFYNRKSKVGYLASIGFMPTIYKRLYILGELKFQNMEPGTFSPDETTFSYNYLTGNLGIGVRF